MSPAVSIQAPIEKGDVFERPHADGSLERISVTHVPRRDRGEFLYALISRRTGKHVKPMYATQILALRKVDELEGEPENDTPRELASEVRIRAAEPTHAPALDYVFFAAVDPSGYVLHVSECLFEACERIRALRAGAAVWRSDGALMKVRVNAQKWAFGHASFDAFLLSVAAVPIVEDS